MQVLMSAGKVALGAAQVVLGLKQSIVGVAGFSYGHTQGGVIALRMGREQMERGAKRFMEGMSEVNRHISAGRKPG